jgi:site-specific recombinase
MHDLSRPSHARQRLMRLSGWVLLVALLLFAQTSALMHRVVHGQHGLHAAAVTVATAQPASPNVEASAHHWVTHLWGDHGQRTDCQLFDQLAQMALPTAVAVLPVLAVAVMAALWHAHGPQTLFERFYSAQAPPVLI